MNFNTHRHAVRSIATTAGTAGSSPACARGFAPAGRRGEFLSPGSRLNSRALLTLIFALLGCAGLSAMARALSWWSGSVV